jgi:hypothetical protein
MPFTFSHPALILPFLKFGKRYFSTTGLTVGSMVPDVEYFLKFEKTKSVYSHSLPGIFWFNLPIALVVCFIFHRIIRNPLIHNSPEYFTRRLAPYLDFSWRKFFRAHPIMVIISIVIGSCTHLAADGFLHYLFDGADANTENIIGIINFETTAYKTAHFISSSFLLFFLINNFHSLPKWERYRRNKNKYYMPSIFIIAVTAFYLIILKTRIKNFEDGLVVCISTVAIAIFITSILVLIQKSFKS